MRGISTRYSICCLKGVHMVFCGKCGFQLTSGNITCPRCGTPTEAESIIEDAQTDSPTIASSSFFGVNPPYPGTPGAGSPSRPGEQQPLILGSNRDQFGAPDQMANEPTGMMDSQTAGMPGQATVRSTYPGYAPQSAASYPQQSASYSGYGMQGGTAYQPNGTSSADAESVRARGRVVALLLILIGLLFILGAMVLFILTRHASTSTSSSIQQVQATFALLCLRTR
jgi:hypothetical protein